MWQILLDKSVAFFSQIGYSEIIALMAIESSFFPLPSEIIIPPAAYLASQGNFNIFLLILAGVIGSILGASFNYLLSLTLGRVIIYRLVNTKLARIFLLNEEKLKKAEKMFLENASWATFCGRLIPVVRHLISIPAGFCKMNFSKFVVITALGSFVWVTILAAFGYFIGTQQVLILEYAHELSCIFLLVFISVIVFKVLKRKKKRG